MTTTDAFLTVGAQAPVRELTTAEGEHVGTAALWSERPLVLVFLCPLNTGYGADNAIRLRDSAEAYLQAGGELVAVVPDVPADAASFKEEWNIPYQVLCDPGHALYHAFGVTDESPGSFVVDTDGTVRYLYRNHNGLDNASTWDLVDAVCALTGATVKKPAPTPLGPEDGADAAVPTDNIAAPHPGTHSLRSFSCAKCGHHEYDVIDVSTTSGMMSRLVNLQNRRFSAVVCRRCTYTEFYKTESGKLRHVFDLLVGA